MAKAYRQNKVDSQHVLSQAVLPRYLALHPQLNNRTAVNLLFFFLTERLRKVKKDVTQKRHSYVYIKHENKKFNADEDA